jgi:Hypoxia induced protein conserved region
MGNTVLILLLVVAMLATVVALVRGVIAFLRTTEEDLKNGGTGPSASSVKQNRAMMHRVMFQALAILLVVILLFAARG